MIVVGYDATPQARAFAARRAGRQGTVVAVHAVASAHGCLGQPYYNRAVERAQLKGRAILDDLPATGGSAVETTLLEGRPADGARARRARARRTRTRRATHLDPIRTGATMSAIENHTESTAIASRTAQVLWQGSLATGHGNPRFRAADRAEAAGCTHRRRGSMVYGLGSCIAAAV